MNWFYLEKFSNPDIRENLPIPNVQMVYPCLWMSLWQHPIALLRNLEDLERIVVRLKKQPCRDRALLDLELSVDHSAQCWLHPSRTQWQYAELYLRRCRVSRH